ncbi:MAG: DUF4190 domain-containing protein [bacterium]|nr:DUF4190 domain-containing protein [bacterium]
MKKCPTCDREFDDAMRFCQTDGTTLVDAAPEVDPYKTMVASKADIAAMMPPISASVEPGPEPPEEVLDLPAADPKKTMYASEDEIRSAMAEVDSPLVDIPPVAPEPAPPAFIAPPKDEVADSGFSKTTPPIPSPFGGSPPPAETPAFNAPDPEPPAFAQAEPPAPAFNPFNNPPEAHAPLAESNWTPTPAAQNQAWQNEPMQNPQYQPGSGIPAGGGQNQTLAIVSLVSGILGLTLCCGLLIPSVVAVITGFMARSKASNDPANYGGSGLALGGLIAGAIGVVGNLIVLAYVVLNFAVLAAMMAGQV